MLPISPPTIQQSVGRATALTTGQLLPVSPDLSLGIVSLSALGLSFFYQLLQGPKKPPYLPIVMGLGALGASYLYPHVDTANDIMVAGAMTIFGSSLGWVVTFMNSISKETTQQRTKTHTRSVSGPDPLSFTPFEKDMVLVHLGDLKSDEDARKFLDLAKFQGKDSAQEDSRKAKTAFDTLGWTYRVTIGGTVLLAEYAGWDASQFNGWTP